jgi:hypothetical protein
MPRPPTRLNLVREIRKSIQNGTPYSITFTAVASCKPALTAKQRQAIESDLRENYERWAASWIYPRLDELERILMGKPRETHPASLANRVFKGKGKR